MESAMTRFWLNRYIQRIDVCETYVDNGQAVTYQTRINWKYPLQVRNNSNSLHVNHRSIRRARGQ